MNLQYFPHFIRKNFPAAADFDNETITEVGKQFKAYLKDTFSDKMDRLELIWNIDPMNVILNENNLMTHKGYHPALLLHFSEFIDKMKE